MKKIPVSKHNYNLPDEYYEFVKGLGVTWDCNQSEALRKVIAWFKASSSIRA